MKHLDMHLNWPILSPMKGDDDNVLTIPSNAKERYEITKISQRDSLTKKHTEK